MLSNANCISHRTPPTESGGLECAIGTGNVGRYDDAIRLAEALQLGLPAKQTILPGALQQRGYSCAIFGKWHLGYEPQFNPMEHGWDDFFGYMGAMSTTSTTVNSATYMFCSKVVYPFIPKAT